MNNDIKKLKDIEYYQEIIDEVVETEKFKDFKEKYKEHKLQKTEKSIIDAYVTKVSYGLFNFLNKNLNSPTTTFAKDRETLNKVGNYLDDLEVLRERINLNNTTTAKKDPLLKYKANNPYFVSYNQMQKEFDMAENKKNSECEVCSKNMYWINKTIKTVRGLRFGRQEQYAKDNRLNRSFFGNILYNSYNSKEIRNIDTKIIAEYNKYLENKIEFDEFKENKNFKVLKETINKTMKDNASLKGKIPEIDTNFLMQDLTMSNLLNKLYIGKTYYMEKAVDSIDKESILKRNKIKAGIIKEKGTNKRKSKKIMSVMIPKYAAPFEVIVDETYIDRDADKLGLDFKNKERIKTPYKKTINYKITKEQEEKLDEITENFEILNPPAKELISFTNKIVKGKTKEILKSYNDDEKAKEERDTNVRY